MTEGRDRFAHQGPYLLCREAAGSAASDPPVAFRLGQGQFTIGRSPSCAIALKDFRVSRVQVKVTVSGPTARIADEWSKGGSVLNGQRLTRETPLVEGDQIRFGGFLLTFSWKPPSLAAQTLDIKPTGGAGEAEARG